MKSRRPVRRQAPLSETRGRSGAATPRATWLPSLQDTLAFTRPTPPFHLGGWWSLRLGASARSSGCSREPGPGIRDWCWPRCRLFRTVSGRSGNVAQAIRMASEPVLPDVHPGHRRRGERKAGAFVRSWLRCSRGRPLGVRWLWPAQPVAKIALGLAASSWSLFGVGVASRKMLSTAELRLRERARGRRRTTKMRRGVVAHDSLGSPAQRPRRPDREVSRSSSASCSGAPSPQGTSGAPPEGCRAPAAARRRPRARPRSEVVPSGAGTGRKPGRRQRGWPIPTEAGKDMIAQ